MKTQLTPFILFLGLFLFIVNPLLAQTPNNVPTNGNVGLGTNSPTKKLEVLGETELNGRVIMDSSLIVKDSAQFDKDVRVKKRFTVEQKSYFFDDAFMKKRLIVDDRGIFKENVIVNQNFRLDGNARVFGNQKNDGRLIVDSLARFKFNAIVNQNFRVDGNTRIIGNQKNDGRLIVDSLSRFKDKVVMEGDVIMNDIDTTSNFNNKYLLFTNANGKVFRTDFSAILGDIIQPPFEINPCGGNTNGVINNPKWWNGTNKLFTCPPVKIGVGTSSPLAKFHLLDGDMWVDQGKLFIRNDASANGNPIEIRKGNDKIFMVNKDGIMYSTEVRVRLSQDFPDYVFKKDYSLMPLNELKAYINQKGHLPGIAPAKEMEEKGEVDLGDMNLKLLEKIEELTLYMIQLKEENEEIKRQLEKLTK